MKEKVDNCDYSNDPDKNGEFDKSPCLSHSNHDQVAGGETAQLVKISGSKLKELNLEEAHHFIARLIAHGESAYLPIFERLERELEENIKRKRLLAKALEIAGKE